MCEGAMRALRKRLACAVWHEQAVFLGLCGGKHRSGSDSEKLFPLSRNIKGGIPYSGTLLLSLASEKEGETNQNAVIKTE